MAIINVTGKIDWYNTKMVDGNNTNYTRIVFVENSYNDAKITLYYSVKIYGELNILVKDSIKEFENETLEIVGEYDEYTAIHKFTGNKVTTQVIYAQDIYIIKENESINIKNIDKTQNKFLSECIDDENSDDFKA